MKIISNISDLKKVKMIIHLILFAKKRDKSLEQMFNVFFKKSKGIKRINDNTHINNIQRVHKIKLTISIFSLKWKKQKGRRSFYAEGSSVKVRRVFVLRHLGRVGLYQ